MDSGEMARRVARRRRANVKAATVRRRVASAQGRTGVPKRVRRGPLPGALPDRYARVLLAVIDVHATQGRATVREVMAWSGLRSTRSVHEILRRLDGLGLVDYGVPGGLRPLVGAHQPVHNPGTTA